MLRSPRPGRLAAAMRLCLIFLAAALTAVVTAWAWLGAPENMPASPLRAGDKLDCVSFAPFRGAQNPLDDSTRISPQQIEDDLAKLARISRCVRTYSVDHGLDQVAPLAAKYGLAVMQGVWLSSHPDRNEQQIKAAIALANKHPDVIRSVIVGNEVLLRGEMSATALAEAIRRVKAAVSVPVTYADVWEFWLRHAALREAVDFITIHILPYWEDMPVAAADAAAHVDSIRARVAAAFPGTDILIGETGWPSAGRMREAALPSPINEARVLHEVLAAARRGNYAVNIIEAFDQPWKRALEGTVGGYWGLFDDRTRMPKFTWGEPVSNHPQWRIQALAGILVALAVFAGGWRGARSAGSIPSRSAWAAVGLIAAVAGILFGWAVEKMLLESLGLGGWLRAAVLTLVALAAPVLAAAALTRGGAAARFAELLGGAEGRARDPLALALGACLLVVTVMAVQVMLGLVFDPRYRDFPFAALGAAVVPYLLLALRPHVRKEAGSAATAERIAAAVLVSSAGFVAVNEGFANWQAQATALAATALAFSLIRWPGGRTPG